MRRFIREIPIRIKDAVPDLFDRSLPPARLRAAVGIDSSRAHYVLVGSAVADAIVRFAGRLEGQWLDFGCGSGRIARHIAGKVELTGVDIDRDAVAWCASHLRGDFRAIEPQIPLPFEDATFDVVYAVSVFTHLDEEPQFAWLEELRRVLKRGGKLIASTHPPLLTYNRPDMTQADHEGLNATGFAFRAGVGGFNEDSAFHRPDYVLREWRRYFSDVQHHPGGLLGYQDVVVAAAPSF
jgi:SAM-dependent methyltransferase